MFHTKNVMVRIVSCEYSSCSNDEEEVRRIRQDKWESICTLLIFGFALTIVGPTDSPQSRRIDAKSMSKKLNDLLYTMGDTRYSVQ